MATQYGNRIRVNVTSTGTGTASLGTALSGFKDLSGLTSGSTVGYAFDDGSNWEVGTGVYTSGSPSTLTRTVESSTNSNAAISLSGSATAMITLTAAQITALAPLASPTFTGTPAAPTPAISDNSTTVATTAFVAPALNNTGRNFLHNSAFTVQQRGTGAVTANGSYSADRWLLLKVNDTDSVTIVTLADADRTAISDEYAQYALQNVFTGSATTGSYSGIFQRVESARRMSNKSVTASFWAKASSGTPKLGVSIAQVFGTGGTPSATVYATGTQTAALSTTWTHYTATISMPSVSGKTFGTTAGTDYTQLGLVCSDKSNTLGTGMATNQTGTVQIYGVQLEVGSTATALERRDPLFELSLCQRFYQYSTSILCFGYAAISGSAQITNPLPTSMRAVPTAAFDTTSFLNCSSVTTNGILVDHVIYKTGGATATGTLWASFNVALSADL